MTTFEYFKRVIVDEYLALKELLIEQYAISAALVLIVIGAIVYLKPFHPHTVTMAVGPPGTPSYVMAQELVKIFERDNISLKFKPSVGSVESIHLLESPHSDVDITLIVGGSADEKQIQTNTFYSLGSIGYSPIWIFYRKDFSSNLLTLSSIVFLRSTLCSFLS